MTWIDEGDSQLCHSLTESEKVELAGMMHNDAE